MSERPDARLRRGLSVSVSKLSIRYIIIQLIYWLIIKIYKLYFVRLTGCLSLLKWLVDKVNAEDEDIVCSPTGTIPLKALDFAIKRCNDYISTQSHEDIDQEGERVWSHQWDQFISWYYQIIHGQAVFIRTNVPFNVRYLSANNNFFIVYIHFTYYLSFKRLYYICRNMFWLQSTH